MPCDYVALLKCGMGPHSDIYKCARGSTTVAIKVIDREFWDEREDRALRALRGVGGMLQRIDLVVTPLEVFVITPHYDRGDVLDGINRGGYGTLEQCRTLLYEIVLLVRRLHQHGFCHNDLKFENFLRRDDGRLVLIDFGFSRPYCRRPRRLSHVNGTEPYTAPEVYRRRYSGASDVFSLGVMIYMLFGLRGVEVPPIAARMCSQRARDRPLLVEVLRELSE